MSTKNSMEYSAQSDKYGAASMEGTRCVTDTKQQTKAQRKAAAQYHCIIQLNGTQLSASATKPLVLRLCALCGRPPAG